MKIHERKKNGFNLHRAKLTDRRNENKKKNLRKTYKKLNFFPHAQYLKKNVKIFVFLFLGRIG